MEIDEMRQLPPREILSEAEKLQARLWKLRFQAKGDPVENPGELKQLRRDRARLMTVLREKELAEAKEAAAAKQAEAVAGEDSSGSGDGERGED